MKTMTSSRSTTSSPTTRAAPAGAPQSMTEKVQQDLKQAGEAATATPGQVVDAAKQAPGQVSDGAQKSATEVKEALTPKK